MAMNCGCCARLVLALKSNICLGPQFWV
jgi:hypothetical protein